MNPERYLEIVNAQLGASNPEQSECLKSGVDVPTFIVAGPGSGKTRVLVQRALRHVCVDRIHPECIVITTFTEKAAKEIRSRLIEWGEKIINGATAVAIEVDDGDLLAFLDTVDVNRFVTGTLDSLCENALEISRTPAEPRYTLLDPFAAKTLLSRRGRLTEERRANAHLDAYLGGFTLDGKPTRTTAEAVEALKQIADRIIHDLVDDQVFSDTSDPGRFGALQVIKRYDDHLEETAQLDFPRLERVVLHRLKDGREVGTLGQARAILVDEYQDTNPLQEQIYFELVRRNRAAFTVVGDDDQSVYRFRGATIELFRDFANRAQIELGCKPITPIYLQRNYRSSLDIVDFFNAFIKNDPDFNPGARVQPLKPEITAAGPREPFPVLGIFRETPEQCADAVASFLTSVFEGSGVQIGETGQTLRGAPNGGNYGDAVLLAKSVKEFGNASFGNEPKPKFPYFLRLELAARNVRVYNPRGRPSHDVADVRRLLGLILESLDPKRALQSGLFIREEAKRLFNVWRAAATALVEDNPISQDGKPLANKLTEMQDFASPGKKGPQDRPVLDFVYAFTPYFERFSDDPEHQVYLEGISRAAAQLVSFSPYGGSVLRDGVHHSRSLEAALRDFLAPLAEGDIDVDEDIFADVPRACLNMMTIHQAKGLEFPLVLVDVSTEFKGNYLAQRFKRFPEKPSSTVELEEAFAPFADIGPLRQARSPIQRTFEDIVREYYVAYSRPEAVLVLVGNGKTLASNTPIKHIGQFWRRDGSWAWTDGYPIGKGRPNLAETPFVKL